MLLDKNVIEAAIDYAKNEFVIQHPEIMESWINFCDGKYIIFSVQVSLGNNQMVTLKIRSEIAIVNSRIVE